MSQVNRRSRAFAVGFALLAVLAVGCSKKHGAPFDPDGGHPEDFFPKHSAEYKNSGSGACAECHGIDLLGGIATVSCFSTSRDGQSCHPGGPGGHPAGWRALHSADSGKAATCAPCHDNKSNDLAPNCFNNSLCHGAKSGHPSGWRSAHSGADPSLASSCAACHQSNAGTPGCFNNTLCHGSKSQHPAGWLQSHSGTNQNQASVCAGCHQSNAGTPGCFNNTLCHGSKSNHPVGWLQSHTGTNQNQASVCAGCHQSNPGTPGCFNNTLCHGVKAGTHPAGWSAGSQHGASAKAAPGGSSGFGYCQGCHGSGLNGGSAGQSCLVNSGCHGWGAPHASSGWNGGGSRHRTTSQGNAPVCAQCHLSSPGVAGCFNSTLCHGN